MRRKRKRRKKRPIFHSSGGALERVDARAPDARPPWDSVWESKRKK